VRSGSAGAASQTPGARGSRRASLAAHHHGRGWEPSQGSHYNRRPPANRSANVTPRTNGFPLESGCKPGSVPASVTSRGRWSFLWAARCRAARATNLEPGVDAGHVGGETPRLRFGLAPGGVCRALPSPGERCAFTTPFHPCLTTRLPARPAVCFLLHFPSSHLDWPLTSTLPMEPGLSSTATSAAATIHRTPAGSRPEYSASTKRALSYSADVEGASAFMISSQ